MKKSNIITIKFYKTNRKNAKEIKRLQYQYDNYGVLNGLYNIIDTYINQENQHNYYFKIEYSFKMQANKGLAEFYLNHKELRPIRVYSIEQFINKVVPVLVMANGDKYEENNDELLNAHNNKLIRQLIDKYYHNDLLVVNK